MHKAKAVNIFFIVINFNIIGKNLKENDKNSHRKASIERLFLKILQYSQENNYVGVSI